MPNKMLTKEEVSKSFLDWIEKESGGDIKKKRALVYDFQTIVGRFKSSEEERSRYIETGHV